MIDKSAHSLTEALSQIKDGSTIMMFPRQVFAH